MNPSTAYGKLKSILKAAGLPDIRFHDLRHTFATMAIANGMDVKNLSATIGHVSATTTLDIYSHRTAEMEVRAAENIERGIGKCEPSTVPPPEKPAEEPAKGPNEPFTPLQRQDSQIRQRVHLQDQRSSLRGQLLTDTRQRQARETQCVRRDAGGG
jgi:hypothetical protein